MKNHVTTMETIGSFLIWTQDFQTLLFIVRGNSTSLFRLSVFCTSCFPIVMLEVKSKQFWGSLPIIPFVSFFGTANCKTQPHACLIQSDSCDHIHLSWTLGTSSQSSTMNTAKQNALQCAVPGKQKSSLLYNSSIILFDGICTANLSE